MLKSPFNSDFFVVLLSIAVQLPLAFFLGHQYDQRIFLDTGYLVNLGLNPYQPHVITVFSNPQLIGANPVIGYPPLWPLLLGSIYHVTYDLTPNLFLYNFAIKIPVIVANIGLAVATKTAMQRFNMPHGMVRFAWLFLLFNPFTLLTTTAWGQLDTLIALLCVSSLYFLSRGEIVQSSLLLALSIVLKPIAFPLLGLPIFFLRKKRLLSRLVYPIILFFTVIAFWILPFHFLGWAPPASLNEMTSFFRMAGGLTIFNIFEVTQNTAVLPTDFSFMGYLWIPALLSMYYLLFRSPPKTSQQLIGSATVLLLTGFLSRTWLSEPNINLLLPLALIMMGYGVIGKKTVHLLWIIPFAFLFLNYAVPQLFFLMYPSIIPAIGMFDLQIGPVRVMARFALTVVWYIVAIRVLYVLLRTDPGFKRMPHNP